MEKHSWSEVSSEAMSFEAIKDMYKIENVSGVSRNRYDPGARFLADGSGCTYASRYHVIKGKMKFTDLDQSAEREEGKLSLILSSGEFVDLEKKIYWHEVVSDEPAEIVKAVFFGADAKPPLIPSQNSQLR